jgi:hypothetical protein
MGKKSGVFLPQKSKHYKALVTQATTAAPAIGTEIENDLSAAVVPTRTSAGLYPFTLVGAFTANKTIVRLTPMGGAGAAGRALGYVLTSADVITVHCDDLATPGAADSGNFSIEIEVFE